MWLNFFFRINWLILKVIHKGTDVKYYENWCLLHFDLILHCCSLAQLFSFTCINIGIKYSCCILRLITSFMKKKTEKTFLCKLYVSQCRNWEISQACFCLLNVFCLNFLVSKRYYGWNFRKPTKIKKREKLMTFWAYSLRNWFYQQFK